MLVIVLDIFDHEQEHEHETGDFGVNIHQRRRQDNSTTNAHPVARKR